MKRRDVLISSVLLTGIAGCLQSNDGNRFDRGYSVPERSTIAETQDIERGAGEVVYSRTRSGEDPSDDSSACAARLSNSVEEHLESILDEDPSIEVMPSPTLAETIPVTVIYADDGQDVFEELVEVTPSSAGLIDEHDEIVCQIPVVVEHVNTLVR